MKTYELGLLHTAAFRGLKGHTLRELRQFDLTSYQWALLGVVFEHPKGIRTTALAEALHVSKPFITKAVRQLTEKKLLTTSTGDNSDNRAVVIALSTKGKKLVPKIETQLFMSTAFVFVELSPQQRAAYIEVLRHIVLKTGDTIDDAPIV